MNNVIETMVKHPIRTSLIITAVAHGTTNIIATIKGRELKPLIVFNINDKKLKNELGV